MAKMTIHRARVIAALVKDQQCAYGQSHNDLKRDVRAAFHKLHDSADRGNKSDRASAKVLWDFVGTW